MKDLQRYQAIAEEAARFAGELLRSRPNRLPPGSVRHKGAIDLVTEVDLAAEARIRERLASLCADIPVQGEEGGGVESGLRWVVDPLDGTTNFVHGYPFYCVSIGLCEGSEPLCGCIYDPVRDHAYVAFRGGGARRNGEPVMVSDVRSLADALAVTGFPYDRRDRAEHYLAFVAKVLKTTQGMRRSGSAAMDLATLCAGQVDFFWEFGLHAWDTAAGAILVREAGGKVSRLDGSAWGPEIPEILASNGWIHDEVIATLAG